MIKAIPTKYAGTNFRSRLEARWAAYFDLNKWDWSYEPLDLDGWCPDFGIHTKHDDVFIEVKPVRLQQHLNLGRQLPSDSSFEKARKHCRDVWVLLLGVEPSQDADFFGPGTLMDPPQRASCEWWQMLEEISPKAGNRIWREAGNLVQWRGVANG